MLVNILHRTAQGPKYGIFREQQRTVHELGIRCTVFLHYRDLFNDTAIRDALEDRRQFGDEIGLALHDMSGPGLENVAGNLPAIWLFDAARKRVVLETILAKYREVFGQAPRAVASYHFDSSSLQILKSVAPEVGTVVGGCFEEGVRVFHGCNHSWYLFNEGMPWNPWYPSRTHALRPAVDEADSAGVVAVPHLVRDMSLSYEGRNDFWASHPPNVVRGMGNEASFNPYDLNLIDQYRMQEDFNGGYSYLNSFVGANWLTWNHNSEYPPEVCWHLYRTFLGYLAELKAAGSVRDLTLSEYGGWHRTNRRFATPEVYLAKEMLYGSGKHYVWFLDSRKRFLLDTTQAGSIGDIRNYGARVPVATGPDTPHREIGSYPYLVQSQHRTGSAHHHEDGARTSLLLLHGTHRVDLATCRTKVHTIEKSDTETRVTLTPATFRFPDGLTGEVVSRFRFEHNTALTRIEREVRNLSQPETTLRLVEHFKGAPGRTEYAEPLHDITLAALDAAGLALEEMPFDYAGVLKTVPGASAARARMPNARSCVTLAGERDGPAPVAVALKAGNLFSPYVTLQLHYELHGHGTITTRLLIDHL